MMGRDYPPEFDQLSAVELFQAHLDKTDKEKARRFEQLLDFDAFALMEELASWSYEQGQNDAYSAEEQAKDAARDEAAYEEYKKSMTSEDKQP